MQAILVGSSATGRLLARPGSWRPSVPQRRRSHRTTQVHRQVAASAAGSHVTLNDSEFARMVASGKLTKTAVSKLGVAELRCECERLALPSDGLKAALVERLLDWWQQEQQQQPGQDEQQELAGSNGAHAQAEEQQGQASGPARPELEPSEQLPQPDSEPAAAHAAAAATSTTTHQFAPSLASSNADGASADGSVSSGSAGAGQRGEQVADRDSVSVTWLGTSSGNPTRYRNVSAIAVRFGEDLYLVDCGEGTRNQLRKGGIDPAAIRRIFITHMHGDHCFGIGGVVDAICEARLGTPQQSEPIHIYGPPELQSQVLSAVKTGSIQLTSPVVVTGFVLDPARARAPTPADKSGMLVMALQAPDQRDRLPPPAARALQQAYDQGSERIVQPGLTWTVAIPGGPRVGAAQLQHRVPCWGYVFLEATQTVPPPAEGAAADAAGSLAGEQDGQQQEQQQQEESSGQGERWVRRGRKLVVLGDTCDSTAIAPLAAGCDMVSHEATFCAGMEEKAAVAQHSTTEQAGAFAAAVGARNLVLTHFSARYESLTALAHQMRKQVDRGRAHLKAEIASRDLKKSEMQRLVEETARTYGRDSVYLANDFYTFTVPPPTPIPAERLQQLQAQQAQHAKRFSQAFAEALARGVGQEQAQQAQQQWRRPQGGRSYQGQGQQRRQGGRPQQYQQRRGQGQGWRQPREQGQGQPRERRFASMQHEPAQQ